MFHFIYLGGNDRLRSSLREGSFDSVKRQRRETPSVHQHFFLRLASESVCANVLSANIYKIYLDRNESLWTVCQCAVSISCNLSGALWCVRVWRESDVRVVFVVKVHGGVDGLLSGSHGSHLLLDSRDLQCIYCSIYFEGRGLNGVKISFFSWRTSRLPECCP